MSVATKEIGNLLARWASQAQSYGACASSHARRVLSDCAAAAAPKVATTATFEQLEGRTMLSAATLSNGVLTLTGDQNATNSLTVDGGNGTLWVNCDGHTLTAAESSVKSINIEGGDGVDWVYINPAISIAATINTYGGNDNIQGGSGYDTISAGDGNDYVKASGKITLGNGNNTVWVGSQGSYVSSGTGLSTLIGGPGNDTLIGGNSSDSLIGGSGTNQISFSTGSVSSSTGSGTLSNSGSLSTSTSSSSSPSSSQTSNVWLANGVLYLTGTTSQENSLTVDVGSNGTIWANANGHTLNPSASSVQSINISGGNGVDWVYINPAITAPATINTYGGNDNIQGGGGYDTISAGDGNDYVKASGKITLGNGNNTVWVGSQGSYVSSGTGLSTLIGGPGNDTLIGGNASDSLIGGSGTNQISFSSGGSTTSSNTGGNTSSSGGSTSSGGTTTSNSGSGNSSSPSSSQTSNVWLANGVLYLTGTTSQENSLTVDVGSNGTIWANANGHTINPSASSVTSINISGGNGVDWVYINPAISTPATINTYGGNDNVQGGGGYDTINTGDGNDYVKASGNITLGNGNNTVWVGSQGSTVTAGNGNNLLVGGPGNDTITAGSGYNTIVGGAGADVLTGGNNTNFTDASSQDKVTKGGATVSTGSNSGSSNSNSGSSGSSTSTTPPVVGSTTPTPPANPGQVVSGPEDATVYGSNHGDSLAPTPVMILTGTSGQAEHSVFVNALNSSLASGTPLTATYTWNFGDSGSRFNTLAGWNAGHIYDNPGTYTITLTVTNEAGHSSSVSTQITISASTRRTLFVDAWNGNDSNSGTSSSSPLKTWQRADQLMADNTTVLFRRGEEFDFGDTFNFNNKNVTIGAYGSGANPVMMKVPGGGHGVFYMGSNSDQVVIEDLTFDSVYKPSGNYAPDIDATAIYPNGRNITFRDNTILNMEDAVDSYQSPTGLLIQDNTAPNQTGLRGYLDWMSGTDQVIIGNTVVNTTRQHIVRSSSTNSSRVLIAGNNFDNPADAANGDTQKTTINIRAGTYIDIESNTLSDGSFSIGPDSSLPAPTAVEWMKINGNSILNCQTQLHGSVHHVMFSNNIMQQETYPMLDITPTDPDYSSRYMQDITVSHNTGILQGAIGTMLQIDSEAQWQTIKVVNNLLSAPNMQPGNDFSSAVIIKAWDLNGEIFSHNVWAAPWAGWTGYAGGVNLVDPGWAVNGYKTAQQWNAYSGNVQDDQFRQVWVNSSNYTTSIDGQIAGAATPVKLS